MESVSYVGMDVQLILRGKPSQVAVTAVARELAGFIWAVMVGKTEVLRQAA